jgi:hypothetical protein
MKYSTRWLNKNVKISVITSLAAVAIAFAGLSIFSSDETASDLGAPGVQVANFLEGSLTKAITTEDCTLSDGTETTCYRIEVTGSPVDTKIGLMAKKCITLMANSSWIYQRFTKMLSGNFTMIQAK